MIRAANFFPGYTPERPMNHARIGYENYPATATGTAGQTYGPDVVTNPNTYERWDPAGSSYLDLDFGAPQDCTYVALGAHNLMGQRVVFEFSSDLLTYQRIDDFVVTDPNPLMLIFNTVTARYFRLQVLTSGCQIGVVYVGRHLEMYRGIYSGHSPITLSRKTVKNLNKSIRGQFLGTSVVRTGLASDYSWDNVPIPWYEQNIEPLSVHAQTRPFFIAWNPAEHPDHTAFGYSKDDISPRLSGTVNYCSFGFEVDAYHA